MPVVSHAPFWQAELGFLGVVVKTRNTTAPRAVFKRIGLFQRIASALLLAGVGKTVFSLIAHQTANS